MPWIGVAAHLPGRVGQVTARWGKPQDATGASRIPLVCLRSVPFLQALTDRSEGVMAIDSQAEIAASVAALQDLGPGYDQALAEGLVERIGADIDKRIAAGADLGKTRSASSRVSTALPLVTAVYRPFRHRCGKGMIYEPSGNGCSHRWHQGAWPGRGNSTR